jgi:hypothetical protein
MYEGYGDRGKGRSRDLASQKVGGIEVRLHQEMQPSNVILLNRLLLVVEGFEDDASYPPPGHHFPHRQFVHHLAKWN